MVSRSLQRSSLDNLVVGFASLCAGRTLTSEEGRKRNFPILGNQTEFNLFLDRNRTILENDHKEIITRIQPIELLPEMPETEDVEYWIRRALRDCAAYSNHDKHRRLSIVGVVLSWSGSVSHPGVQKPQINIGGVRNGENFASYSTVLGFGDVTFNFATYLINPSSGALRNVRVELDAILNAIEQHLVPLVLGL